MLRRLVFVGAFVLVGLVLLIAVVLPDLRLGFMTLAAAIVAGCWWVARQLPARPMSILELRADAAMTSVLGVTVAVLFPSTRSMCDCPPPPGAPARFACNCAVDHHIVLRLCIVLLGAGLSVALAAAARRRARAPRPAFHEA